MDHSPYRDNSSAVYRSRSTSFSTPVSNAFVFQEVLALGSKQLMRSYSCGQVFANGQNKQTFQSMQIQISNCLTPLSRARLGGERKCLSVPRKLAAIDYHNEKKQIKAKKSLPFAECEEVTMTKKPGTILNFAKTVVKRSIYLFIIVITILYVLNEFQYSHCNQEWNIQELSDKLRQSVFGQKSAVLEIENILRRFNDSRDNTVMSFIGSVGVGKTLVSNIVFDAFPWVSSKFIYFYDSDLEKTLLSKSYRNCGCKLVIIDGMVTSNAESALKIVESLSFNNKNMLVILIFKPGDKSEMDILLEKLGKSHVTIHNVVFEDLKTEDVRKCFEVEFERQKKTISSDYLNVVMKNVSREIPGCKKVFAQVSLFPEII